MSGEKLFIVEDELIVADDLKRMLERLGYMVVGLATGGEEAIQKIEATKPELVLMDIHIQDAPDCLCAQSAHCAAAGYIGDSDVPTSIFALDSGNVVVTTICHYKKFSQMTRTKALFAPSDGLNLAIVEKQAAHLSANGVQFAFICGSTGESHSLTVEERRARGVEADVVDVDGRAVETRGGDGEEGRG